MRSIVEEALKYVYVFTSPPSAPIISRRQGRSEAIHQSSVCVSEPMSASSHQRGDLLASETCLKR